MKLFLSQSPGTIFFMAQEKTEQPINFFPDKHFLTSTEVKKSDVEDNNSSLFYLQSLNNLI